jgi:hypothetical protein
MSEPRHYVIGAPVEITVHDDGTVIYEIDTSEAGQEIWNDYLAGETYAETQVAADEALINADHDRRHGRNQ